MRILILEDNDDRRLAMTDALADRFSSYDVEFFVASQPMIDRISQTGLYNVALVSLDHDLEMIDEGQGRLADPGTGVDVAAWLSTQPAVVPVVVATTNTTGGDQMVDLLAKAGWVVERIVPYGGESWIPERWRPSVRDLIVRYLPAASLSSVGVQIIRSALTSEIDFCDLAIQELLRATHSFVHDIAAEESIDVAVLYCGADGRFKSIASQEKSCWDQVGGGAVFELAQDMAGIGPVIVSNIANDDMARRLLQDMGVFSLQIETIQPLSDMQSLLILATLDSDVRLSGHRIQTTLQHLRGLLELVLQIELGRPVPRLSARKGKLPTSSERR